MKTASNKTSNYLSANAFGLVNENSPTSAVPQENPANNHKLQANLRHLNQAYEEQLILAWRFKTSTVKLEESHKSLKEECVRYEKISRNLNVNKLRGKLARLSRLVEPHAHQT